MVVSGSLVDPDTLGGSLRVRVGKTSHAGGMPPWVFLPIPLRMLWDDRRAVGPALLDLGAKTWLALRQPSPALLFETAGESAALPEMGGAVLRHLQELPWKGDGLSLTERFILELVSTEPATAGNVFSRLINQREPEVHLGLGDGMFLAIVERMAAERSAPITVTSPAADAKWHQAELAITPVGKQLLAGELDWQRTGPVERWVGGVRVTPGGSIWRWDPGVGAPELCSS